MLHDPGLAAMTLVTNSLLTEAAYEKYSGQHKPVPEDVAQQIDQAIHENRIKYAEDFSPHLGRVPVSLNDPVQQHSHSFAEGAVISFLIVLCLFIVPMIIFGG